MSSSNGRPARGPITVEPHPLGVTVHDAHRAMLDRRLDDRALIQRVVDLGDVLAKPHIRSDLQSDFDRGGGGLQFGGQLKT